MLEKIIVRDFSFLFFINASVVNPIGQIVCSFEFFLFRIEKVPIFHLDTH